MKYGPKPECRGKTLLFLLLNALKNTFENSKENADEKRITGMEIIV